MEDYFRYNIDQAIEAIEEENLELAETFIKKAIVLRIDAPENFNLLGILSEYRGDYVLAGKFYRASNALDPAYKPAINNLTRITRMQTVRTLREVDLGNRKKQDQYNYYVEYDEKNIGHIKRRG
ncbi:MAG: hypothetical protein AB9856_21280 [Cellulosilyticaceae bacterium]